MIDLSTKGTNTGVGAGRRDQDYSDKEPHDPAQVIHIAGAGYSHSVLCVTSPQGRAQIITSPSANQSEPLLGRYAASRHVTPPAVTSRRRHNTRRAACESRNRHESPDRPRPIIAAPARISPSLSPAHGRASVTHSLPVLHSPPCTPSPDATTHTAPIRRAYTVCQPPARRSAADW